MTLIAIVPSCHRTKDVLVPCAFCHCYVIMLVQKYEYFAGEMYISMSADATCRGLRSPTDGPLTMQLRKGHRSSLSLSLSLSLSVCLSLSHTHTHTHTQKQQQQCFIDRFLGQVNLGWPLSYLPCTCSEWKPFVQAPSIRFVVDLFYNIEPMAFDYNGLFPQVLLVGFLCLQRLTLLVGRQERASGL